MDIELVQDIIERALPSELAHEAASYAAADNGSYSQGRALLLVHTAAELVHPLWEVKFDNGADTYIASK